MPDSYEVVTPALTTHAGSLTGLVDTVGEALAAAKVSIAQDAYGEIGARFAKALGDVGGAGQKALQSGVDGLDSAMKAIRATATQYAKQEEETAKAFDNVTIDTPTFSYPMAGIAVTGDPS
jgi:uncharacterized protein YukE